MTAPLYLTRATLRRDGSVAALLPLLLGDDRAGNTPGAPANQAGHHLVWSLFADDPDRRRDFLWRETAPGTFLILSARPPEDRHALFQIDPPKPFAPALSDGDRLRFSLRANPVVRKRPTPDAPHSTKHDVVMAALRDLPAGSRARPRDAAIRDEGFAWLDRQGTKAGFSVTQDEVGIDGYRQHRIPRGGKARDLAFSTLDFEGLLTVRDPAALPGAIAKGFGSAKAFGCGLLLVRRA